MGGRDKVYANEGRLYDRFGLHDGYLVLTSICTVMDTLTFASPTV